MQSIVTDVQQWCGRSILLGLWSNHRVANVQALRCFSSGYYCCLCIISISLCVCAECLRQIVRVGEGYGGQLCSYPALPSLSRRPQSMSSGRRLSGTTAMTEEDATIMVLAAS